MEELAERIRGLVEQELARLGHRATPRLLAGELVVGSGQHEGRADIRGTLVQWESLPDDLRDKRIRQIAELLAQGLALPVPTKPKANARQKLSNRPGGFGWLLTLLVVALTLGAIFVAYRVLAPNGGGTLAELRALLSGSATNASNAAGAGSSEPDRSQLAGTSCTQTAARVARGALVGPADVEGWQVELVLLFGAASQDPIAQPALARFVKREPAASTGTLVWPESSALLAQQRFDATVEVSSLPAVGVKKLRGLRLLFSGPYVTPYFSEDLRSEYFRLADALADSLGASEGALYAHCAGSNAHYIGSWFLGSSPGNAVASLIYFMNDGAPPFDTIGEAASTLDRAAVATLMGSEQGMISGRPNKPSRLGFPFRDANRASRAALSAARALKLGK